MRMEMNDLFGGFIMDDVTPNFTEMGRRYNVDPRTAKRYYEAQLRNEQITTRKTRQSALKISGFESIIEDKMEIGVSAQGIYDFLRKRHGFTGSYSTVRRYCQQHSAKEIKKATIRFESNPGISARVDWKEDMVLVNDEGKEYKFSIFLFILGHSRYKYLEIVMDRTQDTLFGCLTRAFDDIGGVPKEIWFDNMRQVVDHQRSMFNGAVLNERFAHYSKEAGYKVMVCRPFRPQTKGKIEALARTTERLRVYNGEFHDYDDLMQIVQDFMYDLNYEKSQAINEQPAHRLVKEKEHLSAVNIELLETFVNKQFWRTVSQESMIVYNIKYSVPTEYIGNKALVKVDDLYIKIYFDGELIRQHPISSEPLNYTQTDAAAILKSDVFKYKTDEEIQDYMKRNMSFYDEI